MKVKSLMLPLRSSQGCL